MKLKIIFFILITGLFIITGCNNKGDIQILTLEFRNNKVTGEIKNLSNNKYKVNLNLLFTNESIKEEETCEVIIDENKNTDFSCSVYGLNDNYTVSVDSYDLVVIKKDETYEDEDILNNYEQINNIVNKYMKNGILKHEEFSEYKFKKLVIKYEDLSITDHYYNVEYSPKIGVRINLYFDEKMELEELRLYKDSKSITKTEKKIILKTLNITEKDFNNLELETYKKFLGNDDYDKYPYLYDNVGNTDYKGITFTTNNEKEIVITDYKSTYLGTHYILSIEYK